MYFISCADVAKSERSLVFDVFVTCNWVAVVQYTFTQTIHRTTQNKRYIEQHKTFGRVRAVPRLCGLYPGICLTTEERARKNLSQDSRRIPVTCSDMLQVWLMSLPLEDKLDVLQHDRLPPHINTVIFSCIGSGPRDDTGCADGVYWPPGCPDLAPSTFVKSVVNVQIFL